jgi:hypothetical protein
MGGAPPSTGERRPYAALELPRPEQVLELFVLVDGAKVRVLVTEEAQVGGRAPRG